jgi:hypothetical protein
LPQYHVAQALVEASGLFSEEDLKGLHSYAVSDLLNFNQLKTGEIAVKKELFEGVGSLFS